MSVLVPGFVHCAVTVRERFVFRKCTQCLEVRADFVCSVLRLYARVRGRREGTANKGRIHTGGSKWRVSLEFLCPSSVLLRSRPTENEGVGSPGHSWRKQTTNHEGGGTMVLMGGPTGLPGSARNL